MLFVHCDASNDLPPSHYCKISKRLSSKQRAHKRMKIEDSILLNLFLAPD